MKVELRGQIDKAVVDVVDAYSMAAGIDRTSMVERVLSEWAVQRVREASVVQRIARGNPSIAEMAGLKPDEFGD